MNLSLIAATAISLGYMPDGKWKKEKPEKKCLVCKSPHRHNNGFCSPECCREHKKKNK